VESFHDHVDDPDHVDEHDHTKEVVEDVNDQRSSA
jgi:hypothetical protein